MRKRTFITLVCVITVPMLTAVAVVAYRMNEVSFARCSSFEGERRASCFEKLVRRDVKQRGLAQAQRIWAQRVAVDHGVLSSCHLAWHPIGEARGHQLRRQGKSLLAGVPHNTCEEGFTHGVFIGYTASQHVEPARVARFCAGRTGVLGSPINCVHAVGHVLQRPFKRQLSPRLEQDCLTVARVMVGASRSTQSIALIGPCIGAHHHARSLEALALSQHREGTDELTSLPNRRRFMESLAQVITRVEGTGSPVAALLIDLDNFKQVNDVRGHHEGDLVLRKVASVLRGIQTEEVISARLGGEEFVVLIAGQSLPDVVAMAESLRVMVFEAISYAQSSASVGVAWASGQIDGKALLEQADAAMYVAKTSGKNRVVVHGDRAWQANDQLTLMLNRARELDVRTSQAQLDAVACDFEDLVDESVRMQFDMLAAEMSFASGDLDASLRACDVLMREAREQLGGRAARLLAEIAIVRRDGGLLDTALDELRKRSSRIDPDAARVANVVQLVGRLALSDARLTPDDMSDVEKVALRTPSTIFELVRLERAAVAHPSLVSLLDRRLRRFEPASALESAWIDEVIAIRRVIEGGNVNELAEHADVWKQAGRVVEHLGALEALHDLATRDDASRAPDGEFFSTIRALREELGIPHEPETGLAA